jgi:hypothetical protein
MTQQPPVGKGLLIIENTRSHSDTSQSVGLLWTSDQPDTEFYLKTLTRNRLHFSGGIRTRNPSKRAAADPRLRPRGYWDRFNSLL